MTASEITELKNVVLQNSVLVDILNKAPLLGIKNWYLGAGCISQTYWNYKHGYDLNQGIEDYDLVYFDPDTSAEAQDAFIQKGRELFGDIPVEIVNQARVHLWSFEQFGYRAPAYTSTEEPIADWPTTATCVGLRKEGDNIKIYTPLGVEDILNLTIRANKKAVTEEEYNKKVAKWTKKWPLLKVVPW